MNQSINLIDFFAEGICKPSLRRHLASTQVSWTENSHYNTSNKYPGVDLEQAKAIRSFLAEMDDENLNELVNEHFDRTLKRWLAEMSLNTVRPFLFRLSPS